MFGCIINCFTGITACFDTFTSCFRCIRSMSLLECCLGYFAYKKIKDCCNESGQAMHKCYDDSIKSMKDCYHVIFDETEHNEHLPRDVEMGGAVITPDPFGVTGSTSHV